MKDEILKKMLKAMKKFMEKNSELDAEIETLKKSNIELSSRVRELEAVVLKLTPQGRKSQNMSTRSHTRHPWDSGYRYRLSTVSRNHDIETLLELASSLNIEIKTQNTSDVSRYFILPEDFEKLKNHTTKG